MKPLILVASFTLVASSAVARGRDARDAANSLREAISAIDYAPRECRRAVREDVEAAQSQLRRADESPSQLRHIRRSLDAALRDARAVCPRRVSSALLDATDALDGAISRARHVRRDRDDDVGEPAPRVVDCWDRSDPGCYKTKNGQPPMGAAAFRGLMDSVRASSPHIFPMKDLVVAAMQNQYMTSKQLATLLPLFKPHVFPMVDVVKACAPKLVDPQNGTSISALLQPHVFPAQDAANAIAAQRGDP